MPIVLKSDAMQHLAYGEVYAPNRPDADGEYMTEASIEKMAHDFMKAGKVHQIDAMHDRDVIDGCCVVESFIARKGDPDFIPGSWVVGVYIGDEKKWQQVLKGEINGFSMEALVSRHKQEKSVEIPPVVQGLTSKSEGHEHHYFVTYGDSGKFKGGITDVVDGHSHPILAGTHTQEIKGHSHRFSSVDNVQVLAD